MPLVVWGNGRFSGEREKNCSSYEDENVGLGHESINSSIEELKNIVKMCTHTHTYTYIYIYIQNDGILNVSVRCGANGSIFHRKTVNKLKISVFHK